MHETTTVPSKWHRARRILTGAYFIQRALLLILAAVLSGLVVPLIFKSIDQSRERQQFIYRAQSKLLDDVSETLLTYQTLALDVSWYGMPEARNPDLQKKAFEKYSERVGELTSKLVLYGTRSRTLTSAPISVKLKAFLEDLYKLQDTPINKLWSECSTKCDWKQQHDASERMAQRAVELIDQVARDLGLAKEMVPNAGGA